MLDVRPPQALPPVDVLLGQAPTVQPALAGGGRILLQRSQVNSVETTVSLCPDVEAPVEQGQKLGTLTVTVDGQERQVIDIVAAQAVERLTLPHIFQDLLRQFFMAE